MQKYQVGDDVRVEFIGVVKGIELKNGVTFYRVEGNTALCLFLTVKDICELEKPKENNQ